MLDAVPLLPHLERLLRRIEATESSLIQVWGWPGSGRNAVLSNLLDRLGPQAAGLALADLADPGAVRRSLEEATAAGATWLIANGGPEEALAEAVRRLRPGQRLVFSSTRAWEGPLPAAILPPQELLLTETEVAGLWYLLTGSPLDSDAVAALWTACDGWYRPLRLAIEATGGFGLDRAEPESLLEIPPVRFFLRYEVLETFAEEDLEALLAAPEERPGGRDPGWELLDRRGLWVEGPESDRLPRLLAAALQRERRRRRHPAGSPVSERAPVPARGSDRRADPGERSVYRLALLGAPMATEQGAEGDREIESRLRRSFLVLAYLASSPGLEAGREELVEAVWPNEGEHTIERNFHPTLSHLRRALEGPHRDRRLAPLLFRSGIYRLNPEITWEIDTLDFTRLIEDGKAFAARGDFPAAAESWQAAWRLYRGPFLLGHYDAWVVERREEYQRQYLEALRDLADLYVRLERPEEAMDCYRSVLLEDPLQERVHLAVMRLYAAQGRRDLLRRQYDRLCSLLLDELGVEPMPETTREYHRLMA
jgi:DNA-binding SARP family transcriptional activator